MKFDVSRPGLVLSALGHGTLLILLLAPLWWLSSPPADDGMPEAVPIETISQNDFNQIMKGEKSSKDVTKEPVTKADKVAQADDQHTEPPKPEVQKEAPPPPPPKAAAPTPPVPTPPVPPAPAPPPPPPVVPEPPQRPDPTPPPPLPPEAPPPPVPMPKPAAPAKPAPPAPVPPERDPEAEIIKPAPVPPPKPVPKPPEPPKHVEVKPPPVPQKPVPTPPPTPRIVDQKPPPRKPDAMAKLLDSEPLDPQPDAKPKPAHKPVARAKPAPAPRETAAADGTAEPSDQKAFDPTDISRILNSPPAGAPPSTGRQVSKVASRGATSGSAPKMSPTQSDALDGLLADQFKQCWSYLGLDHGRYIPEIKVSYAEDGSLQSEPQLLNRPSDPNARSLAESALRAVRQCNPLHIPTQFAPFYDQWRSRILRFDPAEMAG